MIAYQVGRLSKVFRGDFIFEFRRFLFNSDSKFNSGLLSIRTFIQSRPLNSMWAQTAAALPATPTEDG